MLEGTVFKKRWILPIAIAGLAAGGCIFAAASMAVAGDSPQSSVASAAALPDDAELLVMETLHHDVAFSTLHGGRDNFTIRRLGPWSIDGVLIGAAVELEWPEPFDVVDGNWIVLDPTRPAWDAAPYRTSAIRLTAHGLSSVMVLVDLDKNLLATVTPIAAAQSASPDASTADSATTSRPPDEPPAASPEVTATGPIPPGPSEKD